MCNFIFYNLFKKYKINWTFISNTLRKAGTEPEAGDDGIRVHNVDCQWISHGILFYWKCRLSNVMLN